MTGMIYTNQKSKLSKKQRAAREALLKEQRDIKKDFLAAKRGSKLTYTTGVPESRGTRHIPSLDTGSGVASKRESTFYTGTAMIGIGQLHKSNAVPVFAQEDAVAIAKMRRG